MPDVGVSPVESLAETAARLRAERIAELRDMCENSLEDLIQAGTGLAVAVAQRAETEINRGFSEEHGTLVLKGGAPAAKGFAQASQCVRRSILLLQQVMSEAWWEDVTAPVTGGAHKAGAKQARAEDDEADAEAGERAERVERVERAETLGPAVGPGQLAAEIARLRDGLRAVSEAAGVVLPELDEVPLPSFAAKPRSPDDDDPEPDGKDPDTVPDPPD